MKNDTKNIKQYRLKSSNSPDVAFNGKMVAFSSAYSEGHPIYGKRWTEISVFVTDTQKVILYISYRSNEEGEKDKNKIFVLDSFEEIPGNLYHSRLSKDIYDQLGIEVVVEV